MTVPLQVKRFVSENILESYHVFAMTSTTKDLDSKLDDAMKSLSLDTEGKLVKALTVRGMSHQLARSH